MPEPSARKRADFQAVSQVFLKKRNTASTKSSRASTKTSTLMLAAMRKKVPAHVKALSKFYESNARAETVAEGAVLDKYRLDADEVEHIRVIGSIGIMASGLRHGFHHYFDLMKTGLRSSPGASDD